MPSQLGELSGGPGLCEPDVAHSPAGGLHFRVASVTLESRYHRVQARLSSGEPYALHQDADKIAGYSEGRRWRLPVHRSEDDRENSRYRWRLANVEVRVEVHPSIADFRNDVNA